MAGNNMNYFSQPITGNYILSKPASNHCMAWNVVVVVILHNSSTL